VRTDSRTLAGGSAGTVSGEVGAGRLLGLPGFRVLAVAEYADEVELFLETTAEETGCPLCGVLATLHDRKARQVRDLPLAGRPTVLTWSKRVWRCREPLCLQGTWSERTQAIRPKAVLTERARVDACRRVGQDAASVALVAHDLGVDWPTIMRAVTEYGLKILDEQWLHTAVRRRGVDETAFLRATATSHTRFVTGLVDLVPAGGGPARLLDVVEGRSGKVVTDWLDERGPQWCAEVEVAALDPFRGYQNAFTAKLPTATVVLDCFHAVKLAHTAVDTVCRRVQHETLGHRGRKDDPLYRIRRVLLRGAEHKTQASYGRLLAGLDTGDPTGDVTAAYIAAQELRHVYPATSPTAARQRLHRFYWACAKHGVPELEQVGGESVQCPLVQLLGGGDDLLRAPGQKDLVERVAVCLGDRRGCEAAGAAGGEVVLGEHLDAGGRGGADQDRLGHGRTSATCRRGSSLHRNAQRRC